MVDLFPENTYALHMYYDQIIMQELFLDFSCEGWVILSPKLIVQLLFLWVKFVCECFNALLFILPLANVAVLTNCSLMV